MISNEFKLDSDPMNEDERVAFDYVDGSVDDAIAKLPDKSKWFDVNVPHSEVTPKVVRWIKSKYELLGWGVGVFCDEKRFQLVFAPSMPSGVAARQSHGDGLPPLVPPPVPVPRRDRRLLVRMPTRGRPAQAIRVLQLYRDMAGAPVTIEVVIDEDDAAMRSSDVIQRIIALGCVLTVGRHRNKIEAVNGGRIADWDILLLASDDMVPVRHGYATEVLWEMEKHWPHLDGAVFFDDGYAHNRCCTLPIMGRRLYDQFGYVYEEAYRSLCCDVEQTAVLRSMNRLVYVPRMIIEHKHPAAGKATDDATYAKNDALHAVDQDTYTTRAARHFDAPPMWLSICILTYPGRRTQLDLLIDHLYAQIISMRPRQVEVLVDASPAPSLGHKRQRLLDRAAGRFVAFVDDDDWVSHDYVGRTVAALESMPDADCASLSGIVTTDGERTEPFEHSIRYKEWKEERGVHERTPNHLNAVRTEIARSVGFGDINHGEDHDYSKRLISALTKEVAVRGDATYFYFSRTPPVVS